MDNNIVTKRKRMINGPISSIDISLLIIGNNPKVMLKNNGRNSVFMFNRTTLGAIRKLKDSAGQYVFQAGMMLTAGVPNTVLGYPYIEAPDLADVGSSAKDRKSVV